MLVQETCDEGRSQVPQGHPQGQAIETANGPAAGKWEQPGTARGVRTEPLGTGAATGSQRSPCTLTRSGWQDAVRGPVAPEPGPVPTAPCCARRLNVSASVAGADVGVSDPATCSRTVSLEATFQPHSPTDGVRGESGAAPSGVSRHGGCWEFASKWRKSVCSRRGRSHAAQGKHSAGPSGAALAPGMCAF